MSTQVNHHSPLGGPKAYAIWSLSALAFGYAFFQRVAPSVMVSDLMRDFAVSAALLGHLSALYFYPYALLQLPLGALIDRYGPRLLLTVSLGFAAVGSVLFGTASSLDQALAGRFLVGAGSAVGFIASLALAARWFPPRHFAFLAGFAMFFAMMCGIAGQAPLAVAVEAFGWRACVLATGVFAAILGLLIAVLVRNAPPGAPQRPAGRTGTWPQLGRGLIETLGSGEVWRIALVAASVSGPMLAFGGLWGVPYLMANYGLPRPDAALLASLTLLGWACGAPLGGWVSDWIRRRKLPLVGATTITTSLLAILVLAPGVPVPLLALLLFAMGAAGGAMVTSYAMGREVMRPAIQGTVTGFINGMTVGSGGLLQSAIGVVLDWRWDGTIEAGLRIYSAADYRLAFLPLLACALVGFLLSLTLRETNCRQAVFDPELRASAP